MTPGWLPNLFIAGVPKAGTSSLHHWLSAHPDAFGATDKEARFFVDPGSHVHQPGFNIAGGLEGYRQQFPIPAGVQPRVVLDSTPVYIYQRAALEHIPDLPGQPCCIFVLREPSGQILSLFNYFQNNWSYIPAGMGFAEYLENLRRGGCDFGGNELARDALLLADYLPWLRQWRDRLGQERMLVCTFDQLRADPPGLTKRLAAWAGLDASFYDSYDFPAENESYAPRSRILQRLNIALREHMPKGGAYRALRGLYRRVNTSKPANDPAIAPVLRELRDSYAAQNALLAAEFGLDLSGWGLPANQAASIPS